MFKTYAKGRFSRITAKCGFSQNQIDQINVFALTLKESDSILTSGSNVLGEFLKRYDELEREITGTHKGYVLKPSVSLKQLISQYNKQADMVKGSQKKYKLKHHEDGGLEIVFKRKEFLLIFLYLLIENKDINAIKNFVDILKDQDPLIN